MAKLFPFIFAVTFILSAPASHSQEKIDTDRPDQTESAATVPRNYFQAEFGFNKENTYNKNYDLVHPTALLKYGFARWELRIEATARSSYEQLIPEPKWTTGFEPVELGCKVALWEEKKWIPKTSLIVHLGIPALSSKSFRPDHVAPSFRFTMQNTFSDHVGLGYNLGAAWDGFGPTPVWLYTLSPNFNIGKRWYAYIEAFGFVQKKQPSQHNVDAGVAYYITKDVKADLSSGFGISDTAPGNYVAIGFSFRVNTKHTSSSAQ